jgi:hypothetical protein
MYPYMRAGQSIRLQTTNAQRYYIVEKEKERKKKRRRRCCVGKCPISRFVNAPTRLPVSLFSRLPGRHYYYYFPFFFI